MAVLYRFTTPTERRESYHEYLQEESLEGAGATSNASKLKRPRLLSQSGRSESAAIRRKSFFRCAVVLAQCDDPEHYFPGLLQFIDEVDK